MELTRLAPHHLPINVGQHHLTVAGSRVRIDTGRDTSTLTVTDALPADSGKYTVAVQNELGRDTCISSVTVDGKTPATVKLPP